MAKYLDESGVRTLWSKIKAKLSNKMDKSELTFELRNGNELHITKK